MLAISHTLISLPFGLYLENPLLIFITAFIFHLFADTFLHWNIYPEQFKRYPYGLVALDVLGGLFMSRLLVGEAVFTLPVLLAIAGGNAPDVIQALWDMIPPKTRNSYFAWAMPFFHFHDHLQLETTHVGRGLVWQIVFVLLASTLIYLHP